MPSNSTASQIVTILLVTHYMDEAERLCDRVALFDRGKIVAIDRGGPGGRAGVAKRVHFVRPL